ncbi:copper amine oxidase N-terminal domain-containing protein [Chengkuizengella axinellae]|uniref:Copper amine oxidase N-terminal domain-containing protein n=1 Tax=Chengkuizengella axinellae TaxID=3064388 RepID=A0ABT9J426_9BACL|nr:copper amine oxidase N-terminal domain-containing protein [Chengkuizengella sp. 2205SS18-9]MDP5276400.1 copper amine oxidase N-terminal domain-containing protein [Chengkuizengella sp. 2205SS18-9]
MKIINTLIILNISCVLFAFVTFIVLAEDRVKIFINDLEMTPDVSPQIVDNRVMVPLSFISTAYGKRVFWDQYAKHVLINDKEEFLSELKELNTGSVKIFGTLGTYGSYYHNLKIKTDSHERVFAWRTTWNPTYFPKIYEADLNGDHKKEIVVVVTTDHGTGISQKELYVFDKNSLSEIPVEKADILFMENFSGSLTDEGINIKINGKEAFSAPYDVTQFQAKKKGLLYKVPTIKDLQDYYVENNILYATAGIQIAPSRFIGELRMKYVYGDGFYYGDHISFSKKVH